MKPGGLRRGAHPGYTHSPRGRHGITQPAGFRPRERLSIRGRGFPTPRQTCCGVLCVLRQGEPPETLHRSTLRQQRRPVPVPALAPHPDGHSSQGLSGLPGPLPSPRPLTQAHLGPQPTAGYQGGLQGKIHPAFFFFCTWMIQQTQRHI